MEAITTGSVLSANVRVNNYDDETKVYDITADVAVINNPSEYGDGNIQNGAVSFGGNTLATWSYYGNLSIQYQVSDAEEQTNVLSEVQQFVDAVRAYRNNVQLTANINQNN